MNKELEVKLIEKYSYMFEGMKKEFYAIPKNLVLKLWFKKIPYFYDINSIKARFRILKYTKGFFNKFKKLFWLPIQKYYPCNPIVFGVECSNGWYELLDNMMAEIQEKDPNKVIKFSQLKEKFGGLRAYIQSGTDEIYDIIDKYENLSYTVCEKCGKPGKIRNDLSWILTLCDDDYQNIINELFAMVSKNE